MTSICRRLGAIAAALALLAIPASANDNHESSYLALGDSYAFAYSPAISLAGRMNPANFPGYTDTVASALDLNLSNAACPGGSGKKYEKCCMTR